MSSQRFEQIIILGTFVLLVSFLIINLRFEINEFRKNLWNNFLRAVNTYVRNRENKLREKLFKGETNSLGYKYNIILNNIRIDLEAFKTMPLTLFKTLIYLISIILSIIISSIIFMNWYLVPIMFVICLLTEFSYLYSMTLNQRYQRLIDSISTENLLSINMRFGFTKNLKENLENIPSSLRKEYENYLTNIEKLNIPSERALQILDLDTGKFSTDFLNNVNIWENHREKGFENVFKDTIEINNLRLLARETMENLVNMIKTDFSTAFLMSYGLYFLEIICMKVFRRLYFHYTVGQIIFIVNILILLGIRLTFDYFRTEDI